MREQGSQLLECQLYEQQFVRLRRKVCRIWGVIAPLQFVLLLAITWLVTPWTWIGSSREVHLHVWVSLVIGSWVCAVQMFAALRHPERASSPHAIAITQGLATALWIHATGGRIETHFHAFVSLAALAAFRDWRVLLGPTLVIAVDHAVRGIWFPMSVFGTATPDTLRWIEHAVWVVALDAWLTWSCWRGQQDLRTHAMQQAALQDSKDAVEAEVQARTEELAAARDEAIRASAVKSRFLAHMSHELRTPLNGILGFSSFLADQGLAASQREAVDSIQTSGEALLAVLNDVLDISKIEADSMTLVEEPMRIRDVQEDAVRVLAPLAGNKGLLLSTTTDPLLDQHFLLGDAGRIRQILLNLLGNAIKFTKEGSVRLSCTAGSQGSVGFRELVLTAQDTGIGIPREQQATVFEAFRQVDDSMVRTSGGTGLGLSISSKLANQMGGSLTCSSEPGRGSCFTLRLALPAGAETDGHSRPDFRGLRIRWVTDRPQGWADMLEQLCQLGADAQAAAPTDDLERATDGAEVLVLDAALGARICQGKDHPFGTSGKDSRRILVVPCGQEVPEWAADAADDVLHVPARIQTLRDAMTGSGSGQSHPEAQRTPQHLADPDAPRARILVVDDNRVNRRLLEVGLGKAGYEVATAEDGLLAVQAAADTAYDLILMDVQMPNLDGVEATRRIRAADSTQTAAGPMIVALTAHATREDRAGCMEAGMDDYLTKPVRMPVLLEQLRSWGLGNP